MPPKSKAQTRFMYAAAEGKVKDGPSKKVAKEYLHDVPEGLPEKAPGRKPLGRSKKK